MENNLKTKIVPFIRIYIYEFIFICLALLSVFYLVRSSGVWLLTDSGFYYDSFNQAFKIAISKLGLFVRTDGFYFGFDNSARSFAHLLVSFYQVTLTGIFGPKFGQILFYLIYYFLGYLYFQKFLILIIPNISNHAKKTASLFYTFSPFSLLISSLFATGYIYALTPAFIVHCVRYLTSKRKIDLLISVLVGVYLISYLRLVPIVVILITTLLVIFKETFFNLIKNKTKELCFLLLLIFLSNLPFFYGNAYSFISSNNIVSNYKDGFAKFEEANYIFKSSIINSFYNPGGFTPSAYSFFYNPKGRPILDDSFSIQDTFSYFSLSQIFFNMGIILACIIYRKVSSKRYVNYSVLVILFVFFINSLGVFTDLRIFKFLHRTILIFLYNDYGFLQFIYNFYLSILLGSLVGSLHKERFKVISLFIIVVYLIFNISPSLTNFYGFKKINNIPENYNYIIQGNNIPGEVTLFAPYHWLKFTWAPYFIDLNFAFPSKFQSMIVPNLRLVDSNFADFYNSFYNHLSDKTISNLRIFNYKNIILFKDVENSNTSIDNYGVRNMEDISKKYLINLDSNSELDMATSNENFSHYRFKAANKYDFFIYSPSKIIETDIQHFFDKKLNIEDKLVIINSIENKKFLSINSDLNDKTRVEIKKSPNNANLYLIKVSNINIEKPTLIQFNQMYSDYWHISKITKEQYENIKCVDDFIQYELSNNSSCNIDQTAISLSNTELPLMSEKLSEENHQHGNYIANLFLLEPNNYNNQPEIYLIIYFSKQLGYVVTLIISLLSLIFISTLIIRIKKI